MCKTAVCTIAAARDLAALRDARAGGVRHRHILIAGRFAVHAEICLSAGSNIDGCGPATTR